MLNGDRLCYAGESPSCYQSARAAFNGRNWDQLTEHWARLRTDVQVEIERLRRWHPEAHHLGPLPAQFLACIDSLVGQHR
jgi:hypothetical protein